MPELLVPEDEEIERQEVVSSSALAILNQSEHAAMVQTANLPGNRRKLAEFDSKLKAYANHSQPIALLMFYSLPRAGKQIIGASVRFAEIVAPCWRNCAVGARAVGDTANTVSAQGVFIDYEANMRNSIEVPRRITDKDGKRYGDDMIVTTINAVMSVARRNAVLKGGVPQALWTPAYEDAQLTAVGKAMSHNQRVTEAMEYLHKLGVTEWQILNSVGVPSPKELETEHLVTLRVLVSEVKRGEKTIEEVFGSPYDKEITSLFTQLKMNDTQQRMLRNSYMGRAKDLVEYLRERLGPVRTTPTPAEKITRVAEAPAKPAPVAEAQPTPAAASGEGPQQDVEDAVAQKSTPVYNEKQEQSSGPVEWTQEDEPQTEPLQATDFGFGANEPQPATVKRGARPAGQGRGRTIREEQVRKAVVSTEAITEARSESAEQVQREVENLIEQDDQFAF